MEKLAGDCLVVFECHVCGMQNLVRVRYRKENESKEDWFHQVVLLAVGTQHWVLSPMCNHTQVDIVLEGEGEKVGLKP